jgi:hypothetical protein
MMWRLIIYLIGQTDNGSGYIGTMQTLLRFIICQKLILASSLLPLSWWNAIIIWLNFMLIIWDLRRLVWASQNNARIINFSLKISCFSRTPLNIALFLYLSNHKLQVHKNILVLIVVYHLQKGTLMQALVNVSNLKSFWINSSLLQPTFLFKIICFQS